MTKLEEAIVTNLEGEFQQKVSLINKHTRDAREKCDCEQCETFRRELGEIRSWINKVKYGDENYRR